MGMWIVGSGHIVVNAICRKEKCGKDQNHSKHENDKADKLEERGDVLWRQRGDVLEKRTF